MMGEGVVFYYEPLKTKSMGISGRACRLNFFGVPGNRGRLQRVTGKSPLE
jgi:hypothetical protein